MVAIAASISGASSYTAAVIADSETTNSITMPSNGMVLAFFGSFDNDITPSTPAGMTEFPTGSIYSGAVFSAGFYAPAASGTVDGKTYSGFDASSPDSVLIGVY